MRVVFLLVSHLTNSEIHMLFYSPIILLRTFCRLSPLISFFPMTCAMSKLVSSANCHCTLFSFFRSFRVMFVGIGPITNLSLIAKILFVPTYCFMPFNMIQIPERIFSFYTLAAEAVEELSALQKRRKSC